VRFVFKCVCVYCNTCIVPCLEGVHSVSVPRLVTSSCACGDLAAALRPTLSGEWSRRGFSKLYPCCADESNSILFCVLKAHTQGIFLLLRFRIQAKLGSFFSLSSLAFTKQHNKFPLTVGVFIFVRSITTLNILLYVLKR